MDVVVERLAEGDTTRLRSVRLRALLDAPAAFFSTFDTEAAAPADLWARRLAGPDGAWWCAADSRSGNDVGLVSCGPLPDHPADIGLFAMWVAPMARRRGVGRRLVEAVLDHAHASSAAGVRLFVVDGNDSASCLYRGMGFVPTGLTKRLPPPRESGESELRYPLC